MYSIFSYASYLFVCTLEYVISKTNILFCIKSGDQFWGRALSVMNVMTTEFSVTPTYYDTVMVSNDVEKKKYFDEKLMGWRGREHSVGHTYLPKSIILH